ncbi:MAG: DUF4440 domain-containing protein [Gemmobacter sp.]
MDGLERTLLTCEGAVWEALVRGDPAADLAALDPDFLGVYPSGFVGRDDHVAALAAGPTVRRYAMDEIRILALAPGLGLIAYRVRYLRTGAEREETMFVSSIWRRHGDGWVNLFSQDTPADGA